MMLNVCPSHKTLRDKHPSKIKEYIKKIRERSDNKQCLCKKNLSNHKKQKVLKFYSEDKGATCIVLVFKKSTR